MRYVIVNGELYHHGIKGMKWGVRRYQNPDGTLTAEGIRRYGATGADYLDAKKNKKNAQKEYNKAFNVAYNKSINAYNPSKKKRIENDERWDKAFEAAKRSGQADAKFKEEKKKVHAYQKQQMANASKRVLANEKERGRKYAKKGKNLTNTVFSHIGKVVATDIALAGIGSAAAGVAALKGHTKLATTIQNTTLKAMNASTWAYRIQDGRKAADIMLYRYSKG